MNHNRNVPYVQGSTLDLFTAAFSLAKMVTEELENIESRNRYYDNESRLVQQAHRLYEQGSITKEQFITIIQQLPDHSPAVNVNVASNMAQRKPTASDLADLLSRM